MVKKARIEHPGRPKRKPSLNADLTDPEWALVSDLFERDGQRGAPPPV